MKKIVSIFLPAAILVSLSITSWAADKPATPALPQYAGVIANVDMKDNSIIVAKKDTDLAMKFDVANAKFVGYKDLSEVKEKDEVTVTYEAKVGLMYAATVSKGMVEPAPKKTAPPQHPAH